MNMTIENNMSGSNYQRKVVIVGGPTASGKSELAVRIAERFDGEVVNADSMQCYRGLDIGTAKPSLDLLKRVPHHLLGVVDPEVNFTAANYQEEARRIAAEIHARGRLPVLVGGTGLYIKAFLSGLADSPGADASVRDEFNRVAEREGNSKLLEILRKVDPVSAARIHPNNRVRIIRALEVYRQTGRSISELQGEHGFLLKWCDSLKLGINVDRVILYERINDRVDRMIDAGLVEEVESLLSLGYSPALKSLSSIGYREICDFLSGNRTISEAVGLIKQNSRRYAKRQLTWFKNDPEMNWFESPLKIESIFALVAEFLNKEKTV
jgi:tRNA dimethylallyltransferase